MTAAQRASRARFKAAVAEAKKLRAKNPRLSQAQAVKQAWAILYSKGRRVGAQGSHKDTRSHNVNIRVVSGVKRKKVGALPVGFTGKFLGWGFRVLNQYTIDGGVTAQIVESAPPGDIVAELDGRPGDDKKAATRILSSALATWQKNGKYPLDKKDTKDLESRINRFTAGLNKEVKDYNSGKDRRTVKKKPAVIKYTPAVKKLALIDEIKQLLADNKKRLKYGYKTVPGKPKIKAQGKVSGTLRERQIKAIQREIKRLEKQLKEGGKLLTAADRERINTLLRVDRYNLAKAKGEDRISGYSKDKKIVKKYTLTELKKMNPIYFEKGADKLFGVYKRKLMIAPALHSQVMIEAQKKQDGSRSYTVRPIQDGKIGPAARFDSVMAAGAYIGKSIIL